MEALNDLQSLEPLADLVLVSADGIEFRVHRVFLARSSLFFREMFSSGSKSSLEMVEMPNSDTNGLPRVQLPEFQGCALEIFLNCVYSPFSGISCGTRFPSLITEQNLTLITEAARKYQMPSLLAASDDFCCRQVKLCSAAVVQWMGFAY